MKKIITAFLSLAIFTTTAFAVSSFTDVNNGTYYKSAIDWMAQNEVINGYPDGSFGPDICVNRVELLKMLFKTLDVNIESYDANLFSDTPAGQWYTQYVIAGRARGTINGYPDGTFKPGQCVNRAEAIKMAILEFNNGEIPEQWGMFGNPYDIAQVTGEPWWMPYFRSAMGASSVGTEHFAKFNADWSGLGVDSDFANPTYNFGPGESMTRKEVAEMLYRMKAMQDNNMEYYDGEIIPDNLLPISVACTEEGESLGAVVPSNFDAYCCEGLVPYLEDEDIIGTMGICVDENNVPLTKQEAQSILENSECFYDIEDSGVSLDLEGDEWVMSKSGCGGVCTVDKYSEEVYIDVNPMCTGAL